jgi:hypothetical protein
MNDNNETPKVSTEDLEKIRAYIVNSTIRDILELLKTPEDVLTETPSEQLIRRAHYNRDNAKELYGDVLELVMDDDENGHWIEKSSGKNVAFTPYGWIAEQES